MDLAGKTGTSQVVRIAADKIYQKCQNLKWRERHHGLFAGYAPAGDPKIAIAVIVEHGCSGSGAAAPIAREVVKTYLQKYYPELYSDKVLAVRLKAQGALLQLPPSARGNQDEEELTPDDGNVRTLPEQAPLIPAAIPQPVRPAQSTDEEEED
jgi:hypothetical protein